MKCCSTMSEYFFRMMTDLKLEISWILCLYFKNSEQSPLRVEHKNAIKIPFMLICFPSLINWRCRKAALPYMEKRFSFVDDWIFFSLFLLCMYNNSTFIEGICGIWGGLCSRGRQSSAVWRLNFNKLRQNSSSRRFFNI